jgi:hypothetical protein
MAVWTCRKCGQKWPRTSQLCTCGAKRPAKRRPKHQLVLETPYEWWVSKFGERCGICGRPPGPNRRLDRDHDHKTGEARGLLCHRCNRALPDWITTDWLRKAILYLLPRCERCGNKIGDGSGHGPGFCIDRREEVGAPSGSSESAPRPEWDPERGAM